MIHYAKLHAVLTQGSPINVRIFKDRKEAAQWLSVPIELLAADASDEKYPERVNSSSQRLRLGETRNR